MKNLLIDLDHTLWDTDGNCIATWKLMYGKYGLSEAFPDFDQLCRTYLKINENLWAQLPSGRVTMEFVRTERFVRTLLSGGIDNRELAQKLSAEFMDEMQKGTRLMPYARETLQTLRHEGYTICIATNGLHDVQTSKMTAANIMEFVDHLFVSDTVGYMKPDVRFFNHILQTLGCRPTDCIMIGDNPLADIMGAQSANIRTIWYNSRQVEANVQTEQIGDLRELPQKIKEERP